MEKVMYHVWKADAVERDAFRDQLVGELPGKLSQLGVRVSRAAIYDDCIDMGTSVRVQSTRSQPDAVVSVWLNSANSFFRAGVDAAIDNVSARMFDYLVTESEPIHNDKYPEEPGRRID